VPCNQFVSEKSIVNITLTYAFLRRKLFPKTSTVKVFYLARLDFKLIIEIVEIGWKTISKFVRSAGINPVQIRFSAIYRPLEPDMPHDKVIKRSPQPSDNA
jgi:hypothetical protein